MTGKTTILVPIRYPLTDASARTLAVAGRLAAERTPADLVALHVNLFQVDERVQTGELTDAISNVLEGVDANVVTRRGFFVEEIILEELEGLGADLVVVGADRRSLWRRLLGRLTRDDPVVGPFLRSNAADGVEVVEVDTAAAAPRPGS